MSGFFFNHSRDSRSNCKRRSKYRSIAVEPLEPRQLLATVTPSADVVGTTPDIVGYNVAHFLPGSNAEAWWQYSGVNGARLWVSSNIIEPNDDNDVWGDGVSSRETFLAQRDALRNDPLNTDFINWPYIEDRYANNGQYSANRHCTAAAACQRC